MSHIPIVTCFRRGASVREAPGAEAAPGRAIA